MNEEFEKEIQDNIKNLKDKTNILHFSTGADSVASFLRLREWGIDPILIYDYYLPHIPMVDNYIDYFEKKFNTKVYQFPSSLYLEATDNALYQLPIKARETFRNDITEFELWKLNNNKRRKEIIKGLGVKKDKIIFHKGIRYTDGAFRYFAIKNYGVMHKDGSFYPIASFKVGDIQDILRKHDCKLPIEYKLWGISFESPRPWNIKLLRRECPKSYEYILQYFPLIKANEYRDKFSGLNNHFKSRVTQFEEFAMSKEGYEDW